MEKKIPVSSSPYEQLIPNRKQAAKKADSHPGFTEEEITRNEVWHGVKKEEVTHLATVHSLDEAQEKKTTNELRKAELKKVTAAEMRESREREEKEIEAIAKESFDRRMRGEGAEAIDKMLIEKGVKPWTPEAEEFMKKWDWEQAEQALTKLAQEREAAVVKANEAEPKKKIDLQEYQDKYIDQKFAAFNIDLNRLPEALREEYETLTYGQRLLLAENLQQLTLGRVQEEALQKYQDDTKQSKFLGKIWKGVTKKYQIAKHEQSTALSIKEGGLEYHGELLKQLVEGTKRTGLDAKEGKGGMLELQYVEAHPLMTEKQKEETQEFNRVATLYSKVPYEWSLDSATAAQKSEYARVAGQFEKSKEQILKTEQGIIGDKDSLLFVSDIESKIRLNQFFNTHPEAEKQMQSIESDAVWKKALGDIVTERGLYFGAGVATRTFATSLLGAVGFPIAAMGMGGWMARKRAAETLRQREIEGRHGKKDTSKEAWSTATAHVLSEKLQDLVKRINSEDDETKRQKYLAALQVRLEYTKNKLNDGRVDFGSIDRRIVNQYGLMDALTMGSSISITQEADRLPLDDEKNVYRNFRFQQREEKISKAQKDYLRKQMIYGAGLGVAAFASGYYAKEILHAFSPAEAAASTGPMGTTSQESIMRTYSSKPVQMPMSSAHESVAFGAAKRVEGITPSAAAAAEHVVAPSGAAKVASESVATTESFHETVDISTRGPEGAFIDELKKHPEIVERLGIKDAGKAAHAAWVEFAKEELKDPETQKLLSNLGYPKTQAGYGEMMRHIEHGKIMLEESNGKLHMRIAEEDTEYLRARPVATVPEPEELPAGQKTVFGEAPFGAEPPATIVEEHIAPEPQIVAEVPEEPTIDVEKAFNEGPVEGILAPSREVPHPSVEVFADGQFGLDSEEYGAIKGVKVETLLKQIPSRDEGWAIWRGEVPGKEITLPHDGIYGAMEFKKHIDLAEHVRSLNPDATAMQGDVDTLIKNEIKSKWPNVPEASTRVAHAASPVAEVAQPSPATTTPIEDIPVGQRTVFGETPVAETISSEAPAVESIPTSTLIASEKITLLNDDIYNSRVPVQKIITQYRVGNITADDFANYYSEKVAKAKPSPQILDDLTRTLRDAADGDTIDKRFKAQQELTILIRRMQSIK